jgi:cytochrome c oxidase subunit 1
MPSPSYWPVLLALGLPIMAYGIIFTRVLIVIGGVIVLLSMFAWALEPSVAAEEDFVVPPDDGGDPGATKELTAVG